MRFKRGIVVGVVGLALVATACGSSKSSSTSGTSGTAAGNVKYDPNATLTYYLDQEPSGNWNVNNNDANAFDLIQVANGVWPQVFHIAPDYSIVLDKNFMISAEQTNASPQTIVYKINPKAKWSDGVPITADDFIYNWQTQNADASLKDADGKPFNPASSAGYNQVQSITAAPNDPYTVTMVFKTPFADWKGMFGCDNPLVPAHIAKKVGWNTGFSDPVADLVSGGPFMVKSYTKGNSITLVRNPNYWGPSANLASVTFRYITDSSQLVPAVQNGEINAGWPTPQLDQITQFKQVPNLKLDLKAGLQWEHLDFNWTNKWLKDDAVRAAIMKVVDRNAMIARTVGQIDPSIKPLNNRMFVPGQQGFKDNSGGQFDAADIAGAKKILTDAGYTYAGDGSLQKGGQKVTMRISSTQGNKLRSDEEQYVIAQAKQIGITVTETDVASLGHTLSTGNFDMIIFAFVTTPFPSGNDGIFQSTGGQNYSKTSDPAIDKLITQADDSTDLNQRLDLYNQIDAIAWKDHYNLPLFQRPTMEIYNTKYLNISNNASAEGPTWNIGEWGVKAP